MGKATETASSRYRVDHRNDPECYWIAKHPELPGCVADGKTPREALSSLDTARKLWIESRRAAGLRAEGLEPSSTFHADYPWEHWYLASEGDLRSSYQCEVFATEFEIQGLELDWIGVCWGG